MSRLYYCLSLVLLMPAFSGCSPNNDQPTVQPPPAQVDANESQTAGIALLENEADQLAARQQGICPVSGEPLGSMGKPIKLTVEAREVFICCSGCEDTLREEPEKYFAKLDAHAAQTE